MPVARNGLKSLMQIYLSDKFLHTTFVAENVEGC